MTLHKAKEPSETGRAWERSLQQSAAPYIRHDEAHRAGT